MVLRRSPSPEIYFGEGQSGYVIVNTERQEIDYQAPETTKYTSYSGKDGVKIGSGLGGFIRKPPSPCGSATSTRSSPAT